MQLIGPLKMNKHYLNQERNNGKSVAIIGGGPAGLSAARELGSLGL